MLILAGGTDCKLQKPIGCCLNCLLPGRRAVGKLFGISLGNRLLASAFLQASDLLLFSKTRQLAASVSMELFLFKYGRAFKTLPPASALRSGAIHFGQLILLIFGDVFFQKNIHAFRWWSALKFQDVHFLTFCL